MLLAIPILPEFSKFIPHSVMEWTLLIICVLLLITVLLFNKGVTKLREIVNSYVSDLREYNKFLEFNNLEKDFEDFKKRIAIQSVFKGEDNV